MTLEVARRLAEDDRTWETVIVDEGGGGATFPDQWTVDPVTGTLEIDETGLPGIPITAKVDAGGSSAITAVIVDSAVLEVIRDFVTNENVVVVANLMVNQAILGETWVYEATENQENVASFTTDDGATRFTVYDHNQDPILEVRNDGSVHIKTGTSIVADL